MNSLNFILKNIIFLLFIIPNFSFTQDFTNKEKQFDLKIFKYLLNETENDSITMRSFLIYSKPFSKWDIRPMKTEKVWAMDSIYTASEIPNFIWGSFAQKYKLTQQEAMNVPNILLKNGIDKKNDLGEFLINNRAKFNKLSSLIKKSKNYVYLNQKTIQRIDQVYKENTTYWSYVVDSESPYPISDEISIVEKFKFSDQQNKILNLLSVLNIHSAIKTDKGIFFIVDGFTDNSYGFYYSSKNKMETDNFLFELMKYEKITDTFFYYIAN